MSRREKSVCAPTSSFAARAPAFARAGDPKRLCVLDAGHFAPYEPPHFVTAAAAATEWFAAHLRRR